MIQMSKLKKETKNKKKAKYEQKVIIVLKIKQKHGLKQSQEWVGRLCIVLLTFAVSIRFANFVRLITKVVVVARESDLYLPRWTLGTQRIS